MPTAYTHGPTAVFQSSSGAVNRIPSINRGTASLIGLPSLKLADALLFPSIRHATTHISLPAWAPISKNYGLPGTFADAEVCIKKVYNCLIHVNNVMDAKAHPEDLAKFLPGGDWSNPEDLEAAATSIVFAINRLHSLGQQETPLWLTGDLRNPMGEDYMFTFHQRLHWVCFLIQHWKSLANRFMCQIALEAHVARIWSLVCMQPGFLQWWQGLTDQERQHRMEVEPYQGMTHYGFALAHQSQTVPVHMPTALAVPPRAFPVAAPRSSTTTGRPVFAKETEAGPSGTRRDQNVRAQEDRTLHPDSMGQEDFERTISEQQGLYPSNDSPVSLNEDLLERLLGIRND